LKVSLKTTKKSTDITSIDNIKELIINLEKLYFLISDEKNNKDFIDILLNVQKYFHENEEIFSLLEEKLKTKQRVLERIKVLKLEVEKNIKESIKKINEDKNKQLFLLLSKFFYHYHI